MLPWKINLIIEAKTEKLLDRLMFLFIFNSEIRQTDGFTSDTDDKIKTNGL